MKWAKSDINKAKEIWLLAKAFENSSRVIHNTAYDKLTKTKDENAAMPLTYAAFVNHSFSLELYLKCLFSIELSRYPFEHKLKLIFDELPETLERKLYLTITHQ
jgi:hypothetical protein